MDDRNTESLGKMMAKIRIGIPGKLGYERNF